MNIILVGVGKIGYTLAHALTREGHDVTVIDQDADRINMVNSSLDVISICGSVDLDLLRMAGVAKADILIAATHSDETNILCCMVAKKLGVAHTIARVRQEERYKEVVLLREELGLSLIINPEYTAAMEISRVLRFPSAAKVESFAKGRAEMVEFTLLEKNPLCGMMMRDFHHRFDRGVLICAVRRGDNLYIPDGNFTLQEGDILSAVGSPENIHSFFKAMSILRRSAKYVLVVGCGNIGFYLARQLLAMGIHVKILERDRERCEHIKDALPKAEVVVTDGSRPEELEEEGMEAMDALVALTGSDEVNIIVASYAHQVGVEKVVCKINETHLVHLAGAFGVEAPVQPRYIVAQQVIQYVRSMENSGEASGVEAIRQILDGDMEMLEFRATAGSSCVGVPLRDLPIRADALVTAIIRPGKCIIPGGEDLIHVGDSVLVITTREGMVQLDDILKG